ncbi:MAG: hypothetical protein R3314_01030 [Longimicrobiales bacterium]|nr:hypothetical protein [Longimicrobiales bacterium]
MTRSLSAVPTALIFLTAAPILAQEAVRPGEPVEGVLEPADTTVTTGQVARLVPLEAPEGARVAVALESADFDAYAALVIVHDGGGLTVIDENDDAPGLAGARDARVRGIIQPDRSYAIWVGSYEGDGTGAFRLSADTPEPGEAFPVPAPSGSPVRGVLDGEDPVDEQGRPYEVFEVEAGALSRVMALADGHAAPALRLEGPEGGDALAESTALGDAALLDRTVETAGRYRVVVTATGATGPFRLRIWMPPLTTAEMAGLAVGDSLIRHDELGFQMPSPGPDFSMVRGFVEPWGRDLLGDYRIWVLQDTESEAERQVMILWYTMFGTLEAAELEREAEAMVQGLAASYQAGAPIRAKPTEGDGLEYRATIRPMEMNLASSLRCIGEPGDEDRRGRMLCAVVTSESVYPPGQRLLDGMVIR